MNKTKHDWTRADTMTEAEIHAAAIGDPDAQPLTPERLAKMKQTPHVKIIRRALGLSQEELAFRAEIDRSYLSEIENGYKNLSVTMLDQIAVALGVKITSLFAGYKGIEK